MLLLTVSAILISTVFAGSPCCIDRQWEAVFGEVGGAVYTRNGKPSPALINGQNIMHYDYYSKKMAVESTLFFPNGTNQTSDVVIDFSTNTMFVTSYGNCLQMPNNLGLGFLEPCVPDDAVKVRESYIGYGANEIPFTTWQFLQPKSGNVVRLSLTDSGCIPIVESMFGTLVQGRTDIVFIVTNFSPGIKKASIFNHAKNCPAVPSQNDLPDDLRRTVDKVQKLTKFYF